LFDERSVALNAARITEALRRFDASQGPRKVGVELAGGEVRERLVFEVADGELDDGVLAVLGLDDL